ncbi:MAG TPA: hypothetical protein VJU86_14560 [Pyrinomonadaceae bacterium]|nr:hypothetical protein [Pyrinomonadaceae bacterium]
MSNNSWLPRETNTHQDHVIAHVLGTTVLGYFVFDEALYLVLDIGFVWTILLDGEMGLLPHPVTVSELELDEQSKQEIRRDIDVLLQGTSANANLLRINPVPRHTDDSPGEIREVGFFELEERRRVTLDCEGATLIVETSLTTAEIEVYDSGQKEA